MSFTTLPRIREGATFSSLLKNLSEENPEQPAFVFIDKGWNKTTLSRRDVWDNSRKFAAILRHRYGIGKGDIVCNTLVNSPERLITDLGTVVAGATSMHGHVDLSLHGGEDFLHNCQLANCKAVIIDPGQPNGAIHVLQPIQNTDETNGKVQYNDLPALSTVINVRVHRTKDSTFTRGLRCFENHEDMFEEYDVKDNDIGFVFPTSGTTGFPKLVPHTHRSSLISGRMLAMIQGIKGSHSRYFSDRSLGWLGGFSGPYLITGATHILTDDAMGTPEMMGEHILRVLNEEHVDCGVFLARDIELLLKQIKSGGILNKRLRALGISGMPLSQRILKAFGVLTDVIIMGYGSTEVGYMAIRHLEAGTPFKDYCIGVASEGYEIKVVDEEGSEVPAGNFGRLLLRSCTTMPGYLNEPQKTQNAFTPDGFFKVGDVAYRDEEGLVYVLGRQADVIHKGGSIYYPGWLESFILRCPGVEHVTVIGVPDPANYEEICACVIPSDKDTLTKQQLQGHCERLFVAGDTSKSSAVPKYCLFFNVFPITPNGKLDRHALRAEACERLEINS